MPSRAAKADAPAAAGTVSALERGIAVLRCFNEDVASLSNAELSLRTGIPKPTVTRLAATLVSLGMLQQHAETERFSLAAGVVSLARAFLANVDVRAVARPHMVRLAESLGGAAYLAVRDGAHMVLIEIARSRAASLRSHHELGTRIEIGTSALGRACLAAIAERDPAHHAQLMTELAAYYGARWDAVQAGLQQARSDYQAHGYCISLGEVTPDIHSLAVPLAGAHGEPMAINFGGPGFVLTENHLRTVVAPPLLQAAAAIARDIGGA